MLACEVRFRLAHALPQIYDCIYVGSAMDDPPEWDPAKDAENRRKHGITLEEGAAIFEGPVLTALDDRFDYAEVREISIGMIGASVTLTVAHTDRGGRRRIISARRATRSERKRFYAYLKRALG